MPGIAGIIYPSIFQIDNLVDVMLNTLEHRGSSVKDTYRHKNLELGICGGKIAYNDRRSIVAMIDGNIHNTGEILKEIKEAGHKCTDESVERMIVIAFELWGSDFVKKLNGTFSIAIFDNNKNRLLLFRDRMGRKPLYWFQDHNHFIFSSELKGILSTGLVPQTPAVDSLSAYLFFGYIPQDMSPIKGVNKLLPGYYLQLDSNSKLSIRSYWSLSSHFLNKSNDSDDQIVETLGTLLNDAVKICIPPDKKLSCFLGGGIGSASIAYYLSQNCGGEPVKAYTTCFEGEDIQTQNNIIETARSLNLELEGTVLEKSNIFNDLVKIIWYLDEPIADPHFVATWRLCEMASAKSDITFSGIGCDELLGSHMRYAVKAKASNPFTWINALPNTFMRNLVFPIVKRINPNAAYEILRHFHTAPRKLSFLLQNAVFDTSTIAALSPSLSQYFNPIVFMQKFYQLSELEPGLTSFLYFDAKTALADKVLLQYERLAAAHGLNWCTPFLDHRIVEYLAGIPNKSKFRKVQSENSLQDLMQNHLPKGFKHKKKIVRKHFLASWLDEPSFLAMLRWLEDGILAESGLIVPKKLHNLVTQSRKNEKPFQQLWSILTLEIWFRLFINSPVSSLPQTTSVRSFLSRSTILRSSV
ncbi:MAG: asparagine synthase (glutamine-hydrolyzing) [Chlamydiales bacterium]|jgi:asparagine synthase (glutamine-hydrolysing)